MAVIILGAGATRGCSFVDESKDPSCPPLDGDFLRTYMLKERCPAFECHWIPLHSK